MAKRIYRSNDKVICGVCGGISDYFDLDATIIRIAWILITCFTAFFLGVIAYFVCAAILPVNPNDVKDDEVSKMKSAGSSEGYRASSNSNNSSASNAKASGDFDSYFR
ncbi:MAG: PspC domain-containing protein [Treponema sp.]|nr:PspC domain-containing protein [Treponema sp.]